MIASATASTTAQYLTGIAAQGAAAHSQADVLTSSDLKTALDLEAQKQMTSCDATSSCMAEIAAALDAELVISGVLIKLDDDELSLQVAAYDVKKASSAGRRTLTARSLSGFAEPLQQATESFVAAVLHGRTSTGRLRVLVLDVDARSSDAGPGVDAASGAPSRFGWITVGGIAGALVGAGGLVVGGVFLAEADTANQELLGPVRPSVSRQKQLEQIVDDKLPIALGGLIGGATVAVASVALVVFDGVSE